MLEMEKIKTRNLEKINRLEKHLAVSGRMTGQRPSTQINQYEDTD
jgi:hypothetical protein